MSMGFSFEQSQKLDQRQVMSQRMIQSMELLQLPIQKLEERIEQELELNPVLKAAADDEPPAYESDDAAEPPQKTDREEEISISEGERDFLTASEFADTFDDTIDERPARSQNWLESAQERYQDVMANIADHEETLQEHLLAELAWFDLPESTLELCRKIIWNLDVNGRLTPPPEGKEDPLGYFLLGPNPAAEERAEAQKALETVQKMEPRGVGALSVAESLLLQLDGEDEPAQTARILLTEYSADLENNRLPLIAKKTGFSMEKIQAAIQRLRTLNPRPAAEFADRSSTIDAGRFTKWNCDVFVRKEEGRWVARLEERPIFDLHIKSKYRRRLQEKDCPDKESLRKNIHSAEWLIDAVRQRRETLRAVAQAIVDYQTDYFEIGPEKLRPLKMQQIADTVGINVSTVSRACFEKWLLTPRGIVPFKRFFSGAVAASDGTADERTKDSVKEKLRALIDGEDKHNPLSDEELVAIMTKDGIQISRRTVAKYRDALHIPSSRGRKEWK